jgi:cysteine desulfurase/selenocysteine lyase
MKRLYLDNAATSFPKPACVHQALIDYATKVGASAGRGAYDEAKESGRIIHHCRELIAKLINAPDPDHIVMTFNCSDGLNMVIHGLVNPGDHVITTWMDHNSILRPFNELISYLEIEADFISTQENGIVNVDDIRKAIKPNTKLIAVLHSSNVTGTVEPTAQIARLAREHGIYTLIDAAQSLGHWPIDVLEEGYDFLAAPGHKGLLGPLGTGFLYIRQGLEKVLRPFKQGGTGSRSEIMTQPEIMPDKYEPGSHNAIGVAGLAKGVSYILDETVEKIRRHDRALCERFMAGLDAVPKLTWFGPRDVENHVGVFSVRMEGYEPLELSQLLERDFGILTRSGLHCAPLAHKTIGTLDSGGTTRFSFGPFVTLDDIDYTVDALKTIASKPRR